MTGLFWFENSAFGKILGGLGDENRISIWHLPNRDFSEIQFDPKVPERAPTRNRSPKMEGRLTREPRRNQN